MRPLFIAQGVPSPVKNPGAVDMVIFRENCEDIYAGIEFQAGAEDNKKFAALMKEHFPDRYKKARARAGDENPESELKPACRSAGMRNERFLFLS